MASMRQFGVGIQGGAEAIAFFAQAVDDLWHAGALTRPLAKIKIDEKNCFGMLTWPAVRAAAQEQLPKHAAAACWKHRQTSTVEQHGVDDVPKDRGAEQGDVDGPLEAGLAIGTAARASRRHVHLQQREGSLEWAGETTALASQDFDLREDRQRLWSDMAPAARKQSDFSQMTMPWNEIQSSGGIADFWYLDDGDIWCDPALAVPYLRHFDTVNHTIGAERNLSKTVVVLYASQQEISENESKWQLQTLRELSTVQSGAESSVTLGGVTGSRQARHQQLQHKSRVVAIMLDKIRVCADTQVEHVLSRQCLGIGKIVHLVRTSGAALAEDSKVLQEFDKIQQDTLCRLFAGVTDE
eukprot:5371814-Karenia_brevis.AAC.1